MFKKALLLFCLMAGAMSLANASVIPIYVSTSDMGGGLFAYNYDIYVESPGQGLQGTTVAGPGGAPAGGFDNHFTFFDFFGYVAGTASCGGSSYCSSFASNTSNSGPSAYRQAPTDDPAVVNVSWTYNVNGAPVPSGAYLGRFSMESTSSTQGVIEFSGQATRAVGPLTGTVAGNTIDTIGPVRAAISAVPEPASMLLLGMGLIGLAVTHKRFSRR